MTIAIIGAGLAGLSAARDLGVGGRRIVVFDKGGGIGGRIATRRTETAAFDHGAPLLHGLPSDLVAAAGAAAVPWRDGVIGVPGNSALTRALATGIEVRGRTQVTAVRRLPAGDWQLKDATGAASGPYATVLITIPPRQALDLLDGAASGLAGLDAVAMAPAWTLMAAFDRPVDGPGWRTLAAPLGLAVRNSDKPARHGGEAWVVHADPDFARAQIESDRDAMARTLVAAFRVALGAPEPVHAVAHRWRYARTARPLGRACLWDRASGLGLAGDWCLGPDAGQAVASGRALAAAVLNTVAV